MTTYAQDFDGATIPAAPSGWTFSAATVTATSANAISGTKVMTSSGPNVEVGFYGTPDTGGGGIRASMSVRAGSGSPEAVLLLRSTTTAWSTLTAYTLDLTIDNPVATGLAIGKVTAGTHTLLSGPRVGTRPSFPTGGAVYVMQLEAFGTTSVTLVGYVQRRSDNKWLASDGSWVAARTAAVSAVDTTSPLSPNGYFGAAMYGMSGASSAFIDDFAVAPVVPLDCYVSPSGSDLADGSSPATAWKTIAQVNSLSYAPGSTIHLEGGATFNGNLVLASSGTAGAPITLTSYGTGQATINPGNGTAISVKDAEFVTVSNLKVTGPGVSTSNGATTSTGWAVELRSTATSGARLRGCRVEDLTITGMFGGIIVTADSGSHPQTAWRGYDGVVIARCDISLCSSAGLVTTALSNNAAFAASNGHYPQLATPDDIHTNIHVTEVYAHDIYGWDGSGQPYPYTSTRSGAGIRICNMTRGLIEFCRVDNAGHSGNAYQAPANFESECSNYLVWQFNESSNCRLLGNNDGAGFDVFDGNAQNGLVQYNWIHDNDGYGIGGGGVTAPGFIGAISGNVARFNVLARNNLKGTTGDLQFWGDFDKLSVYNNTIYSEATGSTLISVTAPVTNSTIRNNILVSTGSRTLLNSSQSGANVPTFQGNLYWRGSAGANLGLKAGATTYNTLATWRGAGMEMLAGAAVGLVADPQLVSAGATPGKLPGSQVSTVTAYDTTSGSPARSAGLDLARLGTAAGPIDFHGERFRMLGIDVGAYQSGAI
jgi:hypothetical protein